MLIHNYPTHMYGFVVSQLGASSKFVPIQLENLTVADILKRAVSVTVTLDDELGTFAMSVYTRKERMLVMGWMENADPAIFADWVCGIIRKTSHFECDKPEVKFTVRMATGAVMTEDIIRAKRDLRPPFDLPYIVMSQNVIAGSTPDGFVPPSTAKEPYRRGETNKERKKRLARNYENQLKAEQENAQRREVHRA